jgi:hypothetical protein
MATLVTTRRGRRTQWPAVVLAMLMVLAMLIVLAATASPALATPSEAAPSEAAPEPQQPASARQAAIIPPSQWPMANLAGSGCVVARGAADDAPVVKTGCDLRYLDQYWTLEPVAGTTHHRMTNGNSGKCILVRGNAAETAAVQYTCGDHADQLWTVVKNGDGTAFMLKNANSALCLVLRTSQTNARQVGCDQEFADQWWRRGMPQEAPSPTDDLAKPTYFVHGYTDDGSGFDADSYWGDIIGMFRQPEWPGGSWSGPIAREWTYCYYSVDRNCDLLAPGDRERPIKDLGADLAWEIYDHFSQYNVAVDVVAHSMGGLITRAALTGVERGDPDFPPYLYVEDVTTLSTPHRGAPAAVICQFRQCVDMRGSSEFLAWLEDTPQSAMGTNWTVVGLHDDLVAPVWSSVPDDMTSAGHKLIYEGDQFLPKSTAHMELLWRTSGTFAARLCHISEDPDPCDMSDPDTWYEFPDWRTPGRTALLASYSSWEY